MNRAHAWTLMNQAQIWTLLYWWSILVVERFQMWWLMHRQVVGNDVLCPIEEFELLVAQIVRRFRENSTSSAMDLSEERVLSRSRYHVIPYEWKM